MKRVVASGPYWLVLCVAFCAGFLINGVIGSSDSIFVAEKAYAESSPKKPSKKASKVAGKGAAASKDSKAAASNKPNENAADGDSSKTSVDGEKKSSEDKVAETGKSDLTAKSGVASSIEAAVGLSAGEGNEPIYITSDTLTVESKKRTFTYTGSVKMVQGETNIDANVVVGKYDDNNVIQEVICEGNVRMSKGPEMKSTSNRAVYKLSTHTVVLTEGPEITHQGSTLTADIIRVYLDQDRSEAEGNVKVKVVKTDGKDKKVQIR